MELLPGRSPWLHSWTAWSKKGLKQAPGRYSQNLYMQATWLSSIRAKKEKKKISGSFNPSSFMSFSVLEFLWNSRVKGGKVACLALMLSAAIWQKGDSQTYSTTKPQAMISSVLSSPWSFPTGSLAWLLFPHPVSSQLLQICLGCHGKIHWGTHRQCLCKLLGTSSLPTKWTVIGIGSCQVYSSPFTRSRQHYFACRFCTWHSHISIITPFSLEFLF